MCWCVWGRVCCLYIYVAGLYKSWYSETDNRLWLCSYDSYSPFYRVHLNARLHGVEENYSFLPPAHQAMLSEVPQHLNKLRAATLVNQRFVEAVVKSSVGMFEDSQLSKKVSINLNSVTGTFIYSLTKTNAMWLQYIN